ncbi:hypothetical protein KEM48_006915 [Puccinia striiformis f. sp. tritici PST-130]|nr:hypothetical protein KEM48_006915 [Puccinia striiformis f. sp. tritici PST-130]
MNSHGLEDTINASAGGEPALADGPPVDTHTPVGPIPATPATPAPLNSTAPVRPSARPPTVPVASRTIPRRRGRTEDSPKKEDSTGSAMLMMMHKSTEQANLWMIEERKRAEANRADDRREAEARAAEKEEMRDEQRRLAKQERDDALEQLRQDRKDLQARADLAESIRREERQEALDARRLEAERYEATQAKRAAVEVEADARHGHDGGLEEFWRAAESKPVIAPLSSNDSDSRRCGPRELRDRTCLIDLSFHPNIYSIPFQSRLTQSSLVGVSLDFFFSNQAHQELSSCFALSQPLEGYLSYRVPKHVSSCLAALPSYVAKTCYLTHA